MGMQLKQKDRWHAGRRVGDRGPGLRSLGLVCLLLSLCIAAACLAQASPDGTEQQRAQQNQNSTLKTYDPGPPPRPVLRQRPVTPADSSEGSNGNGEQTYSAAQQQAPAPIVPPPAPTDPPPPPVPQAPQYVPQATPYSTPAATQAPSGQAPASLNPLEMKGPMDRPATKPKSATKPTPAKPEKPAKPAGGAAAHPAGTLNPLDMPAPAHAGQAPATSTMGTPGAATQGTPAHPVGALNPLDMPAPTVHTPAPAVYAPSSALAAAQNQVTTAQQTCATASDYAAYINGMASNPEGMREGINQMLQVLVDQNLDPDRRSELQAAMNGAAPSDYVMQQLQNLAEAAQSICTAQTISSQKAMDAVQGVNSKGAPTPLAPPAAEYSTPAPPPQYPPQPY